MLLRISPRAAWNGLGTALGFGAQAVGVTASLPFVACRWAYDAIVPSIRRANPTGVLRSEDAELLPNERAKLISSGRDLHRNFALVGWAVRKHLDYVSTFKFQAKGPNDETNTKLEKFVAKWSKKENFDIAKRHSLERFIRLGEQRRTIDGDVFFYKLKTGKVQAIEGDRIRMPYGGLPGAVGIENCVHGVKTDSWGAAIQYVLCSRGKGTAWTIGGTNFTFEQMLDAKHVVHHAYWDRFDQVRGISPLAPVYNALRDVYEAFDYALAKMKVSQLLGLFITREAADSMGETVEDGTNEDGTPKYKVKFGKDPFKLELDPGDKAEFLESKNPSTEFQTFCQTMIALILKSFDIPYSFYAENFSNYSGSRQALLQYEQSSEHRRADNRDVLNDLTAWRVKIAIDSNDPDLAGVNLEDLKWEWVASALPWIDPVKEVGANAMAVDRGFTSVPDVCKEQGRDAFEIAKSQADYELKVKTYRESLGLPGIPANNPVTFLELMNLSKDDAATKAGSNATAA